MVKWLPALALLAACSDDALTELVLSADSDLTLDEIVFEISAEGAETRTASAPRDAAGPSFVTLVRDRGPRGPLTITARGVSQGQTLLQRTHVVSFSEHQSKLVQLDLYASCVGVVCEDDQTCGAMSCMPRLMSELPAWHGSPPSLVPNEVDAGGEPPADASNPSDEGDAARREDAGVPEQDAASALTMCGNEEVDLQNDSRHCGMCGRVCWLLQSCVSGACVIK